MPAFLMCAGAFFTFRPLRGLGVVLLGVHGLLQF
jgi:hypothetical protein